MSDWLHVLLNWIAPPIIGAVIGFVTNDIAIRMLFRPLTEKRILGIRVPFTPGIIPKQRAHLAASIGRMVSDELLTEDAVRVQIESPRVQEALRENIAGLTGSLLGLRLSELETRPLPIFNATAADVLSGFLRTFLGSPVFFTALESLLDGFLDTFGKKPVKEIVDALKLRPFLDEKLSALVTDDRLKEKLKTSLVAWARRAPDGDAPLTGLVSDGVATLAAALFRSLFPYLLDSLKSWLETPDVRRNLETRGKLLLDDILSKLNVFQRLFLSVGAYDRTLSDKMPGIVTDFLNRVTEALRGDEDREAIALAFERAFDDWRKKSLPDLVSGDKGALADKIPGIVDDLFAFLRSRGLGRQVAGAIGEYLASREGESLETFAASLFGLNKKQITAFVLERVRADDFSARAASRLTAFALEFFKSRGELTVGGLLGADDVRKAEFDDRAVAALNNVLGDKLPEALRSLDLRGLVENKINGLDIREVEGLLLMVIAKQLKWINVFGAILGGFIGLLQVVLRLFGIG